MTEFHIGIRDPHGLRRSVLESLKSVVHTLKRYDTFLEYHRQREAEVVELRKIIREISILSGKLTRELPQTRVPHPSMPSARARGVVKGDVTSEGAKRLSKVSKLDKLAQKLAEIEQDLKKAA